ncbi:hypothetical protein [Roseateles sp.]|uniref:hypothetical protein n=1 Tax=Roseateles sp. TaxID=1971397 RepID=UPI0025ED8CA2|nr:hypothetical protein [Roseateles sp.]MBV8034197.1 GNAT family N-acetyltransferase [Roseateles sp.]
MDIRPTHRGEVEAARPLLARSQVAPVAVKDVQVVGFLRAITDSLFNGRTSMVVVAAIHRGRDMVTRLARATMGERERMHRVLRAGGDGVSAFYETLGFRRSGVAMKRPCLRR